MKLKPLKFKILPKKIIFMVLRMMPLAIGAKAHHFNSLFCKEKAKLLKNLCLIKKKTRH